MIDKVFPWFWLIILAILWLIWTCKALYTFLHWFSYHCTEKRRFWVKHGKPIYVDIEICKTWLCVHIGTLFLASFLYFLMFCGGRQ